MKDAYGRSMGKLRVSLTDRCNMKCLYCMPENPTWMDKKEILTLEEIREIVKVFVTEFAVSEVRLTGGEPLLRNGVSNLVRWISELKSSGLKRISLTTNGLLLERYIETLKKNGLDDLNISLDSLDPQTFMNITRGGNLETVLRGIKMSQELGLYVKINTVLIKGINHSEINTLVDWAIKSNVEIRFIEFMPLSGVDWSDKKVVYYDDILSVIGKSHKIEPMNSRCEEPAKRFLIDGKLKLGIIATVSRPFCLFCNRVRVTSDGRILPCLFANYGYDIKKPLRNGNVEEVKKIIESAWRGKPPGFIVLRDSFINALPMHSIGG